MKFKAKKQPSAELTVPSKNVVSDKLELMITVINRNKTEFFIDLLSSHGVNFQTSMPAQGTAGSETLRLLGLTDSDKSVLFSVIREDKADEALKLLDDKFHKVRGGKGIAFTIPLSGVIGVAIYRFLGNIQ
jgi:hypothetical protein